jgi:hypothetical protein
VEDEKKIETGEKSCRNSRGEELLDVCRPALPHLLPIGEDHLSKLMDDGILEPLVDASIWTPTNAVHRD